MNHYYNVCILPSDKEHIDGRFEVFKAVIMKNWVFCDFTPCGFLRTDVSEELNASPKMGL
jgi:hypothetical protein